MSQKYSLMILMILISVSPVLGIRASADQMNHALNVEVGETHEFFYTIINNQPVHHNYTISFGDFNGGKTDLAKYFRAEPAAIPMLQPGEKYTVKIIADFFEGSESYGHHTIKMTVMEDKPIGGGLQIAGALGFLFSLNILYPGLYADISLKAHDIGENETEITHLTITNNGKQRIRDAHATLNFYDNSKKLIYTAEAPSVSLEPFESHLWETKFPMEGYPPGKYHVTANVSYDGEKKDLNDTYLVGTKQLEIINHTKQVEQNKISPFHMVVESKWNGELKGVWGEIIFNNTKIKTPPIDLGPFEKGNLSTFFDANGIAMNAYPISMRVYYGERIAEKEGVLAIIAKVSEGPLLFSYISLTNLLLLLLVVIMLTFLILKIQEKRDNYRNHDDFDDDLKEDLPKPSKKSKVRLEKPKKP